MTNQTLQLLDPTSLVFPKIETALKEPNGLLAIGGDLSVARICQAYQQGIFPWFSFGDPIMWWSPDPRAIIYTNDIRVNKTLRKFLTRHKFTVSVNLAFNSVIEQCANAPFRNSSTWIVPNMRQAYKMLHKSGYAHSIEVWEGENLVGGLYGVAINGYFSGESMFYAQRNASKIALVALAKLLRSAGITFIDCQINNPFLKDMGCIEVTRKDFSKLQQAALTNSADINLWHPRTLSDFEN